MKKAPISVRIIHILSQIVFWLLIVTTVASFILAVLTETRVLGEDYQLRIKLPVTFDLEETGTVEIYGLENDMRIEQATGQMHVVNTPYRFSRVVTRMLFVVMLLVLFMTWKFKLFITNIKNGEIFMTENINNLKHIAYGILVLWLLTKVYMSILYYTVVKFADFSTIHMNYDVNDSNDMLFIAMLIWILAHIFMKGVEMKTEQELTI